jgi:hypothetical protein
MPNDMDRGVSARQMVPKVSRQRSTFVARFLTTGIRARSMHHPGGDPKRQQSKSTHHVRANSSTYGCGHRVGHNAQTGDASASDSNRGLQESAPDSVLGTGFTHWAPRQHDGKTCALPYLTLD